MASTASTFVYQSRRGLTRSLAEASGVSRSKSKVNLTSLELTGVPSCHLAPVRRKKTRLRSLSCHDHLSASSPTIASIRCVVLSGSKSTRLLKQGMAGDVNCCSEHWRATRSIDEVRTQTRRQTFRAMQHAPPSRKERASLHAEVS